MLTPCAKWKSFVTFNHDGLKQRVAQLQSPSARELMKDTFADMSEGVEGLESMEFVQIESEVPKCGWHSPRRCQRHWSVIISEVDSQMAISIGWQLHQWLRGQRQVSCYFWNWVSPLRYPQATGSSWPAEATSWPVLNSSGDRDAGLPRGQA